MARGLIFVAAMAVGLLAGACSNEPEFVLDAADIDAAVEEAFDFGPDPVAIDCPPLPEGFDPEIGGTNRCLATVPIPPGFELDVDLVIAPAAEGGIAIEAEVITPLFDVAAAAEATAARLDAELGGDPAVECGVAQVVREAGTEIECTVVASGGTAGLVERILTIVIVDAAGGYEVVFRE